MSDIELHLPSAHHKTAAESFINEFFEVQEHTIPGSALLDQMEYEQWLIQNTGNRHESTVNNGWVAATTFFAVRKHDSKIIGMIDIRHNLENEFLRRYGGHIGYSVRPYERKNGYATEILKMGLEYAKSLNIEKVMIGCYFDNIPSIKTIEKCGGVLSETKPYSSGNHFNMPVEDGKPISIYWIDLRINKLLIYLKEEKQAKRMGSLYHKTQINLAYNSNKIEGSRLTEDQTRYIFEARTIGFKDQEAVPVDDIIETSNHFTAFDYMLDTIDKSLTDKIIKDFHRILKSSTSDAAKDWFKVGEWKKLPNEVGGMETTLPQNVEGEMNKLNGWYHSLPGITFEDIVEYHCRFEKIHPFQDGNGRVGRLIMFRECLKKNIIPFIIDDKHKQFYYRGLKEFERERGYLIDTCLSSQDVYAEWIKYFYRDL